MAVVQRFDCIGYNITVGLNSGYHKQNWLVPRSFILIEFDCTVHVTDFCWDEFVDVCGTTKSFSDQHMSL